MTSTIAVIARDRVIAVIGEPLELSLLCWKAALIGADFKNNYQITNLPNYQLAHILRAVPS